MQLRRVSFTFSLIKMLILSRLGCICHLKNYSWSLNFQYMLICQDLNIYVYYLYTPIALEVRHDFMWKKRWNRASKLSCILRTVAYSINYSVSGEQNRLCYVCSRILHLRLLYFAIFDGNGQNKNRWNVWISAIFLIWYFTIVVPLGKLHFVYIL